MTHDEFVRAYSTGAIAVQVERSAALRLASEGGMSTRYTAAHLFWTWIWFLSFPAAVVCFIWLNWWVALLVLLAAVALPRAIKDSATRFVLEQALEDEDFFDRVVAAGVMQISAFKVANQSALAAQPDLAPRE